MLKKIGVVLLVLIVIGIVFGDGEGSSTSSSSNLASTEPDFDVSCASISKEVDANEARASAKYSDKVIKISGRVDSIDEDVWGNNVVNLTDGQEYSFNNCMLNDVPQDIAISLDKGQSVSFTCNDFSEVLGSTSLSNCSIN
tara:strand:- start:58 stop:480 length:423 start_codon:yes stop_codon:yes gene_type:complete